MPRTKVVGKPAAAARSKTIAKTSATAVTKAKATRAKAALAQDIVIETSGPDEASGALAIAPDHTPRRDTTPSASGQVLRAAEGVSAQLQREVEQFLFHQSELLDQKRWPDFVDLFADDGVYWMPAAPEQTDWQSEPSIFAEDRLMMEVRMGRVSHPTAWSQAPMWSTNHLIGNVVIESLQGKTIVVRSRFHMMELRRDSVRHFGGTYRHTLVRHGASLRIRLQRVDMFNAQAPYDYVLQIWV